MRLTLALILLYFNFWQVEAQTRTIYIASNGNDNNNGAFSNPLRSMQGLQTVLNTINNLDELDIIFRQGVYFISNSLILPDSNHSITRIRINAYKKENVILTGGKNIPAKSFHDVSDNSVLNQFPLYSRQHILEADLKSLGITDYGSLKETGFGKPQLPASMNLIINNEPQQLARWPNNGFIKIDRVDTANSSHKNSTILYANAVKDKRWTTKSDIWLEGILSVGWTYDNIEVKALDLSNGKIVLKNPASYGIYTSADSSNGNIKSAMGVRGFSVYNVPEELDKQGEWYLDKEKGKLYVWPEAPVKNATVTIFEKPFLVIKNCSNVQVTGLHFTSTRSSAIEVTSGDNIVIENCKFSNIGIYGINEKNVINSSILACQITNTGAGSIYITGGDRKKLNPSRNLIQNCDFSNSSTRYKGHMPDLFIGGVGTKVIANNFHDIPVQGIIYEGNDHFIKDNHFNNVCFLFSDAGCVYTGRNPSATGTIIQNNFFENINNPLSTMVAAVYVDDGSGGITVRNNLFYNCAAAKGNMGAVHVNGGANNNFINNVFINCGKAFSNTVWSNQKWKDLYFKNGTYLKQLTDAGSDIRSNLYTQKYPFLKNFFDTSNGTLPSRMNFITNTLIYNVDSFVPAKSSYKVTNVYKKNIAENNNLKANYAMLLKPGAVAAWPGWQPVIFQSFW